MNSRNNVPDADRSGRPGQDDASGAIGVIEVNGDDDAADHGAGQPARNLGADRPVQDIQDIIDKLAAVTQQLRRPGGSPPGSPR